MLRRKNASIKDIVARLKAIRQDIGDDVQTSEANSTVLGQREILTGLITYLDSL